MINTTKEICYEKIKLENQLHYKLIKVGELSTFNDKVWVGRDELIKVIKEIEVYKGLVSKIEASSNSGDAICDLIEDRYKDELLKILGVDEE